MEEGKSVNISIILEEGLMAKECEGWDDWNTPILTFGGLCTVVIIKSPKSFTSMDLGSNKQLNSKSGRDSTLIARQISKYNNCKNLKLLYPIKCTLNPC